MHYFLRLINHRYKLLTLIALSLFAFFGVFSYIDSIHADAPAPVYMYQLGEGKYEITYDRWVDDFGWDSVNNRFYWVGENIESQRFSISNWFTPTTIYQLPSKIYVDIEYDVAGGSVSLGGGNGLTVLNGQELITLSNGINEIPISIINNQDESISPYIVISPTVGGHISKLDIYFYPELFSGDGDGTEGDPFQISDCSQLSEMTRFPSSHFVLTQNIDCSAFNFSPIGYVSVDVSPLKFRGVFDGQGHTISNVSINKPGESLVGLFGWLADTSRIMNLRLEQISVVGSFSTGSLAGRSEPASVITNVYSQGTVSAQNNTGGLIGYHQGSVSSTHFSGNVIGEVNTGGLFGYTPSNGNISHSSTSVNVVGTDNVGGLVGDNTSYISNSHASGTITGNNRVGGLLGATSNQIDYSSAVADVFGITEVGGFVGYNSGYLRQSFAYANVTGTASVGGFAGYSMTMEDVYARGHVTGDSAVGGLAGTLYGSTISRAYFVGTVTGNSDVGGLIGISGNPVIASYYNSDISLLSDVGKGEPKSTSEMKDFEVYRLSDWNFRNVWGKNLFDNDGYPFLRWQGFVSDTPPSLFVGGDGTTENPYQITDCTRLKFIDKDYFAHYVLIQDIDCSGAVFEPIGHVLGFVGEPFRGSLDGQGHTIRNVTINEDDHYVGLFAYLGLGGVLKNFHAEITMLSGKIFSGTLVGYSLGDISNVHVVGSITTSESPAGGLVGYSYEGNIDKSSFSGSVRIGLDKTSLGSAAGGLVGSFIQAPNSSAKSITESYFSGSIETGPFMQWVGLLAGENNGNVINSYGFGSVSSSRNSGGLIGSNLGGEITNSYSAATFTYPNVAAGLFWRSSPSSTVSNVFWDETFSGVSDAINQIYVRPQWSCPFLYSWNGQSYILQNDIFPAGMLGVIGSEGRVRPYPHDYAIIQTPLVPKDGKFLLDIRESPDEAVYLDQAKLHYVDVPIGSKIAVGAAQGMHLPQDRKSEFTTLYSMNDLQTPVSCTDMYGADCLSKIAEKDYQISTEDLYEFSSDEATPAEQFADNVITLDLGDLRQAKDIKLVISGISYWPKKEDFRKPNARPIGKSILQVKNANGEWVTATTIGVPNSYGEDYVFPIKQYFLTDNYQIRLVYYTKSKIDYLKVDTSSNIPFTVHEVALDSAELYQFTQGNVFHGYATKYGDVTELVKNRDDRFAIFVQGDGVKLLFNDDQRPVPPGMERRFIFESTGFFKQEEYGLKREIEPLPFYQMTNYPYPPEEYPYTNDDAYQNYLRTWNTRLLSETKSSSSTQIGGVVGSFGSWLLQGLSLDTLFNRANFTDQLFGFFVAISLLILLLAFLRKIVAYFPQWGSVYQSRYFLAAVLFFAMSSAASALMLAGTSGKTTAELKSISTFQNAGWSIATLDEHTNEKWKIGSCVYPKIGALTYRYDVVFHANGGVGVMSPQPIVLNASATLNTNAFTRSGHTFKHWNTQSDGSGTTYDDAALLKMVCEGVTLYAQWQSIASPSCPALPFALTYNPAPVCGAATCESGYRVSDNQCVSTGGGSSVAAPSVGVGAKVKTIDKNQTKNIGSINLSGINVLAFINSTAEFSVLTSKSQQSTNHSIQIFALDLLNNLVTLKIQSTPQFVTFKLSETKNIDLDSDGVNDLSVVFADVEINRVELTLIALPPIALQDQAASSTVSDQPGSEPVVTDCKTYAFMKDLEFGETDNDILQLQKLLNSQGILVSARGAGSMGRETTFFGRSTVRALSEYQKVYNLPVTGRLDIMTRKRLNCPEQAGVSTSRSYTFTRNLRVGMTGDDVKQLQIFLNRNGYFLARSGPGSPGKETEKFGLATRDTLRRFQRRYQLSPADGAFTTSTRAFINAAR